MKAEKNNQTEKKLSSKYISELVNKLYQEFFSRPSKLKEIEEELNSEFQVQLKSYSSNSIILDYFIKLFQQEVINIEILELKNKICTLNDSVCSSGQYCEKQTEFTTNPIDGNLNTINQDKFRDTIVDTYLNLTQLSILI